MLTTTNKARFNSLRKAFVLPVTFAAMVALSVSAIETKATPAVMQTPAIQQPEKPVVKNDTTPAPTKTTKQPAKAKENNDLKNGQLAITVLAKVAETPTPKSDTMKLPEKVLYVVNGKQISGEEVKKIKPDQIASINVLKEKAATEKYGQAGANGVIEIIMK